MPEPPYVSEAAGDTVVISVADDALRRDIQSWGPHRSDGSIITAGVDSDRAKAALFAKLRDSGVAFAGGHGWSPSAVFEELRDRGLIAGSFREIVWRKPGTWSIRERP
jgi:hypothetical protein